MCLLCSACSVYIHVFSCKERVHCSLGGDGGGGGSWLICNIAAMHLCYKLKVQLQKGELSVWKPSAYSVTCWKKCMSSTPWYNFQTSYQVKKFSMIQVNTFPSLVPRPQQRGERVWWDLANPSGFINIKYFLGRIFICQSQCRKHHLWLQHWKPLTTSA